MSKEIDRLMENLQEMPLDTLDITELQDCLKSIQELYSRLEELEPPEEDEEAYDDWLDALETLDDLMDDTEDRTQGLLLHEKVQANGHLSAERAKGVVSVRSEGGLSVGEAFEGLEN